MKRIIFTAILVISLCSLASAQSYYRMWYGGGKGKDDYIANLGLRGAQGIDFTVGGASCGFLSEEGYWMFHDKAHSSETVSLLNTLKSLPNATMGVQGRLYCDYISAGMVLPGPRNSIDIVAYGGYSRIRSLGDAYGLSLSSEVAKKIYLYDNVYFNQYNWMSIGKGPNNDPTINNENNNWLRIGSKGGIALWGSSGALTNNVPHVLINSSQIKANLPLSLMPAPQVFLFFGVSQPDPNDGWIGTTNNSSLHIGANNNALLELGADHKLYIGLSDAEAESVRADLKAKYNVFVAKGILSEDLAISPKSSWADFVFDENYKLRDLKEVEAFISRNKHLPDVPSAKDIATDGYSLHDMNKVLLQKVEELTLYMIDLQKRVDVLQAKSKNHKK